MAYTTINKSSDYFNTKLYTGNGSTNNITGVGFDPDWIWCKSRAVEVHELYDKVRGAGKRIQTQSTAGENSEGYQSFITDGFAWSGSGNCNANGVNYVSWNWKANGAGSSNTDGTITSTVSANTTSGFSIVKYTGDGSNTATIGHGLGTIPSMVIMKPTSYTGAWWITHKNLPTDSVLEFNTNPQVSYSSFGGGGLRQSQYTSSIITGGAGGGNVSNLWNDSGENYIAYCFAEKKGFSKFGLYEGNGNADGAFVYTGFKPAFIIMKEYTNAGQGWCMKTSALNSHTGNQNNYFLKADANNAEHTSDASFGVDFLSNGCKIRSTDGIMNGSGRGFIYMAFAESTISRK